VVAPRLSPVAVAGWSVSAAGQGSVRQRKKYYWSTSCWFFS
jgi:hypothetical protein